MKVTLISSLAALVLVTCTDTRSVPKNYAELLPRIESAVATLLNRYQIDAKSVRTRKVPSKDKMFSRIEQHVIVTPEFNTLNFNHDLSAAVAEFGANVVATERTEDKSVMMHIKQGGVIMHTIAFAIKKN